MALILKSLIQRSLDNFQLSQYEIESNDLHLKKHLRHFKTASRACFLLRKEMILSLSQFFFFLCREAEILHAPVTGQPLFFSPCFDACFDFKITNRELEPAS